jgi:hypothetical protein
MPTINNLTPEQVEMLDFMWNELDSEEDFLNWYDALDPAQQLQAELLQRLMIMECVDEEMLQKNNTDFPEANRVIDRFRL